MRSVTAADKNDDSGLNFVAQAIADLTEKITIAHLINRRLTHSTNSKDYEFSRATVRQLWEAGLIPAPGRHFTNYDH